MLTDPQEDYARGSVPFLGQTIYLDSKPLIPRTETEWWVNEEVSNISTGEHGPLRILDLFAGSGCIGVAVLAHLPNTTVTFGEKEKRHLSTIKKNIIENSIDPERASIVQTDVWSGVAGPFEYIFANPPYVSKERKTVSAEAESSEPHEALFADQDGFEYIEKIIEKLPQFLTPDLPAHAGGICFIEHEPFHKERISALAKQHGLVSESHPDQYKITRYSRLSMA